jgi:hypothetical protein
MLEDRLRKTESFNDLLHSFLFGTEEAVEISIQVHVESHILLGLHEYQLVAMVITAGHKDHLCAEITAGNDFEGMSPVVLEHHVEVVLVVDAADCLAYVVVQAHFN